MRVLNRGSQPIAHLSAWEEWGSGEAAWDAYSAHLELEASGLRVHDDDLDATLLLYVSGAQGVSDWVVGSVEVSLLLGLNGGGAAFSGAATLNDYADSLWFSLCGCFFSK